MSANIFLSSCLLFPPIFVVEGVRPSQLWAAKFHNVFWAELLLLGGGAAVAVVGLRDVLVENEGITLAWREQGVRVGLSHEFALEVVQ